MLVEKIVATGPATGADGAVAVALQSLGLTTTAETLAHAMRHLLHQASSAPFAALATNMPASELVEGLVALGVEPIFIEIARRRMVADGGGIDPILDAEIERHVLDFVSSVVNGAVA